MNYSHEQNIYDKLNISCRIAHVQYIFLAVTFFIILSYSFEILLKFHDLLIA